MALLVRLFGELKEQAGWAVRELEPSPAPTPAELWANLAAELKQQTELPSRIRVAVNQQFADPGVALRDGDEVAFLPPISGG